MPGCSARSPHARARQLGAVALLLGLVLGTAARADDAAYLADLLASPTGFAHRTGSLRSILKTGRVYSAYAAARRGVLADYEVLYANRKREPFLSHSARRTLELHTEIFGTTNGILPADTAYGKYGVVWSTAAARPSTYINTIPNEVVIDGGAKLRSARYIVPAGELEHWQREFPKERFLAETHVPEELLLPRRSFNQLLPRIARRVADFFRLRVTPLASKMRRLR